MLLPFRVHQVSSRSPVSVLFPLAPRAQSSLAVVVGDHLPAAVPRGDVSPSQLIAGRLIALRLPPGGGPSAWLPQRPARHPLAASGRSYVALPLGAAAAVGP